LTSDQLPFAFGTALGHAGDRDARREAVDPRRNVALSASAGTGKTRVLVDRYVNLLRAGVDPRNILAVTFTRKAAAEMRQRILTALRTEAARGAIEAAIWRDLRDRLNEVVISTIDAFCLSLLREFPLEADLDPGFEVADETEVPRYIDEALDRALDITRALARDDEDVLLMFALLGERKLRGGLASLLDRRLAVDESLRYLGAAAASDVTAEGASGALVGRLSALLSGLPGGPDQFLDDGPLAHAKYALFVHDARRLMSLATAETGLDGLGAHRIRALVESIAEHFTNQEGKPRKRFNDYSAADCRSAAAWRRHGDLVRQLAPTVVDIVERYRRDLNFVLARGVARAFAIARSEYGRTLERHGVLDFAALIERTLALFEHMDEFARSRYLLEARYHHVLVDEFQDTSRAQWRLVRLLVRAWSEGAGLAQEGLLPPSIFIVGDAKQSIYGFRDADVSLFRQASAFIDRLRPGDRSRRSISHNFRSVAAILAFVNDLFAAVDRERRSSADAFVFDEDDRFPLDGADRETGDSLGIVAAESPEASVESVASEIVRLLSSGAVVRDRETGIHRKVKAGDIAILFRSRDSHREFEAALEARGIPTYVYKGLGFFDADEIKDSMALVRYLARPSSRLRAAAFLRSRFVRLSDEALRRLGGEMATALVDAPPESGWGLGEEDARALEQVRAGLARWLPKVDRVPPADLFETVLEESAYDIELAGPRLQQARENLKKMRGLVRRIQNRGYATIGRIADHLDRLSAGDESNATIDAKNAVSLMTVHASKGLEFPVVFVVNLARGTGGRRMPIRVPPVRGDGEVDHEAEHAEARAELPLVTVGNFQPDADTEAARDLEETKRLLYVALTRARDRLYLASVLKDGKLQPAIGSLGAVLPAEVRELFERASVTPVDDIAWGGPTGVHRFRICRPGEEGPREAAIPVHPDDDFGPLSPGSAVERTTVTASSMRSAPKSLLRPDGERPVETADELSNDERKVIGRLVHRLMQADLGTATSLAQCASRALTACAPEERAIVRDAAVVAHHAARLRQALSRHRVFETVRTSQCLFEVPFSHRVSAEGTAIVRGVIDCVAVAPGAVTVLEFKTGEPKPSHASQLAAYVAAARALFPGTAVEGTLVYASDA
jgi:ATP-dependent helicase/nuclease subunit A